MKKLYFALACLIMVLLIGAGAVLSFVPGLLEHHHKFVSIETLPATCSEDGYDVVKCYCGEQQTIVLPAGHVFETVSYKAPTCLVRGREEQKCALCGRYKVIEYENLGHQYNEDTEPSRLVVCKFEGCTSAYLAEGNGKYDDVLVFDFGDEHKAEIAALLAEVKSAIESAPKYDPDLHGYVSEGELYDQFKAVEAKHEELYDLVLNAVTQRQIAEIMYYCDMYNSTAKDNYSAMMDYHTSLVADFYSLSQPYYDSCYREFYYEGMTEDEIDEYLFDSNAVSDPEYVALKDRNSEIELEFLALSNPVKDSKVPTLYFEFVQNNKKIAEILGYDNYLEYAYENVYDREYSYSDAAAITDYVKDNLVVVYNMIYAEYIELMNNGADYTQHDINDYYSQVDESFFENITSNTTVNDYIDLMAFTTNPDKKISFSDTFNSLMADGNLFRGDYEGAFVTYLAALDLPIAYFGEGYDRPFTIVHEFGHYMNEIYNASNENLSQSYDLLEMHSQGNEMLYLYTLNGKLTPVAFKLVETYQILVTLDTIMSALVVDTFEQAIYLDSYDGVNANLIMADGTITANEYDLLYQSILDDFGIAKDYQSPTYWRYGMTITSPCYYVSYSISAISVLQLYEMANNDGFDAAKDAYLKLISYTDALTEEKDNMTAEEVLLYAGLHSYNDEALYVKLRDFLK